MPLKKIFLILFLLTGTAYPTQHWVATTGSNLNSGADSASAFASISYALSVKGDGDTVWVCSGWYTDSYQLETGEGFSLLGRGNPGPTWSGGVVASGWSSEGGGMYSSGGFGRVNSQGVWIDSLYQLIGLSSSGQVAASDSSYFFDSGAGRLYIHLPDSRNPSDHSVEVSTAAEPYLLMCSWCNLDGRKIYIRNFTFNLCEGTAIDLNSGSNSAPDSLVFEDCVFRNNSIASSAWPSTIKIRFSGSGLSAPRKFAEFNDCYIWANSQRSLSKAIILTDFPGTLDFNRCYFGNNQWSQGDGYYFDDTGYLTMDYWVRFNRCLFYKHRTGAGTHGLVSMSAKFNLFDSTAFVRNISGVDGSITYQDADSSTVTNCVFVADSAVQASGEGAISACLSSVHPGDGHVLTIRDTRVVNCFAETALRPAGLLLYMSRSGDASSQSLHFTNNLVIGGSSGNAISLQDASLVDVRSHYGNNMYGNSDNNYYFSHAANGNGVSPFGGPGAEYDTTLDASQNVSIAPETSLLNRLDGIGSNFLLMAVHFDQYWIDRMSGLPADTIPPSRVMNLAPGQ